MRSCSAPRWPIGSTRPGRSVNTVYLVAGITTAAVGVIMPLILLVYHTGRLAARVDGLESAFRELKDELRAIVRYRERGAH